MKLPNGMKSIAFADDVCFYKTGRSTKALTEDIQRVGEMFNKWCHSRLLTLSAEKSELILFSRKHHPDPVQITINGHQVLGQEKVKYLGLLLHRKLSWRDHIAQKCNKAKQCIAIIKSFMRLNWGIDSKILKKFYTTLIEPILLYGCPIWNGALKQNWCIKQLRQGQRLMLLAVCRACGTVSTNVILAIAHVLQIDYRATELAASHFFNHKNVGPTRFFANWNSHAKRIIDYAKEAGMSVEKWDHPRKGLATIKPPWMRRNYLVVTGRSPTPTLNPQDETLLHIFTDGSKCSEKVGYAAVIADQGQISSFKGRLPGFCSSFEAESMALQAALKYAKTVANQYRTIKIFTDSLSNLYTLKTEKILPSILASNQILASEIGNLTTLEIIWTRGHAGTEGNELADKMAKKGANGSQLNILPAKLAKSTFRSNFNQWLWKKWDNEWTTSSSDSLTQTRKFFPTLKSFEIMSCKPLSYQVTQVITGQGALNSYLFRINKVDSPLCTCFQDIENVEHVLFVCPFYDAQRSKFKSDCVKFLKYWPPKLCDIPKSKPLWSCFKNFVISTKRLVLPRTANDMS